MEYFSTRGRAPVAGFETVLLQGLAPDGGLYLPNSWPSLSAEDIRAFRNQDYAEVAASILLKFTGDAFDFERLRTLTREAYAEFDPRNAAPLTEVGREDWILELFHGPTLAFKDFAMQILGRLFDDVLERRGKRQTIIAATSGDTGAAAIEALKSCAYVDVVILHPKGRVTDVQRRIMTSVDAPNVLNLSVEGSFDDCQWIVKDLFADRDFVEQVGLSGVNSINWARLAAQTVYYFTAAMAISADNEPISYVVPTGNFGDVFAGYAAKQMGLNVAKLGVATNANDILHRAMTTGDYVPASVRATTSPSMDIQVASNFERLLFDVLNRDADVLRDRMEAFKEIKDLRLNEEERGRISEVFASAAVDDETTRREIKSHYEDTGALIDPHTAVGRVAAKRLRENGMMTGKIVTLSTAHPAKFPDAVRDATGVTPELPARYADLFTRPEKMTDAPATVGAVKSLILSAFDRT
ncbi:MAG: threonine synthase [Pseudomonadota bacterium]